MKVLHTSDWHLGRSLYGQKRYSEHEYFLTWLIQFIEKEHIEILLVSGDIFDTGTPSNQAQKLYYQFLHMLPLYCQAVIIAGNHDSPTFLDAPKDLLECLNVFVVGQITQNVQDEVLLLKDQQEKPKAIICAVPYLRDKDVRTLESGESVQDKNQQLLNAIKQHYAQVCQHALDLKNKINQEQSIKVPIIAMGHLFTREAKTVDGDGVLDLYVGSLCHINVNTFPEYLDYVALGHLHIPQLVADKNHIRYSGSPIPIGFSECQNKKQVVILDFSPDNLNINPIEIPLSQELIRLKGDLAKISQDIEILKSQHSQAWLEIEYTGQQREPNLKEKIEELIRGSSLTVLKIKNCLLYQQIINKVQQNKMLDDLTPFQVFERLLEANNIHLEQQELLTSAYSEILQNLRDSMLMHSRKK